MSPALRRGRPTKNPGERKPRRKQRRRDPSPPLEVIDLISSDNKRDIPNNPQSVDVASLLTNNEDGEVSSATLDEDEDDREIIDVDSSEKLITSTSEGDPGNDSEVESEVDIDDGPPLCPEQAEVVDLIMRGKNVFYTGSAGSGKSRVLKAFTAQLRASGRRVRIVAPTGRAALEVGGSTTWTYAGWSPHSFKRGLNRLRKAAYKNEKVKERLKETDILVIDEISMVENHHFEALNEIMKEVHESKEAFGGVQVVVTGDFHQLPPVKPFQFCLYCGKEMVVDRVEERYTCPLHGHFYDKEKWAFRSKAWKECNFVHFALKMIHRQSDKFFISILNKVGAGDPLTEKEIDLLMNHRSITGNATRLHATKNEVRRVNQMAFSRLKTETHTYKCLDHFQWNEKHTDLKDLGYRLQDGSLAALTDHRFDAQVDLKIGALVVLLANLDLDSKLCNGSQGVICGFEKFDPKKLPRARRGKRDIDPLLVIRGEDAEMKETQIRNFIEKAEKKVWPQVQFHNGKRKTIYAYCSIDCLGNEEPYTMLSRTQIPLAAAWAMSIHKSQSLTMDRVIVDLSRAWENGQVYVALSRATSLEGLKIEGSRKALTIATGCDPTVREFYLKELGM